MFNVMDFTAIASFKGFSYCDGMKRNQCMPGRKKKPNNSKFKYSKTQQHGLKNDSLWCKVNRICSKWAYELKRERVSRRERHEKGKSTQTVQKEEGCHRGVKRESMRVWVQGRDDGGRGVVVAGVLLEVNWCLDSAVGDSAVKLVNPEEQGISSAGENCLSRGALGVRCRRPQCHATGLPQQPLFATKLARGTVWPSTWKQIYAVTHT